MRILNELILLLLLFYLIFILALSVLVAENTNAKTRRIKKRSLQLHCTEDSKKYLIFTLYDGSIDIPHFHNQHMLYIS